jgi:hypothetical protein
MGSKKKEDLPTLIEIRYISASRKSTNLMFGNLKLINSPLSYP